MCIWSYMETLPMSACEVSFKRLDIGCIVFYYQQCIDTSVPIKFMETIQASQSIHQYQASKEQGGIMTEISYGPSKDLPEVRKSCWRIPSLEGKLSGRYVLFSLSNGPENHASQIANAVVVARHLGHLGATLVLPDIKGTKLRKKRSCAG